MSKTFIIAEAGVNHNGSIELATQLIDVAVDAGVDAVKFQTFKAKNIISRYAPKANYQQETTNKSESQLEMVRRLEFGPAEHKDLMKYCKTKGIMFMSAPFDLESIDLLSELGLEIMKIPSGEITNLPYLRKIGSLGKRIIMSTGMADLKEIEDAFNILLQSGTDRTNITILHCNTEYPTPFEDVNLSAMLTIKDALNINVGYSDHTLGIEVAIAAVALGANVIEKHFTLDKTLPGPDHKASLEPGELKAMVQAIRNIERSLGDGIKKPSSSEIKNIAVARKSIVAKKCINKGEVFTTDNITSKRPGMGVSPMEWDNVIGKAAKGDFAEDEMIEL